MRRTIHGVYSIDVEREFYHHDVTFITEIRNKMGLIAAIKVVRLASGCSLTQAKEFVETFCKED